MSALVFPGTAGFLYLKSNYNELKKINEMKVVD